MLMELIVVLRNWEGHVKFCKMCRDFDELNKEPNLPQRFEPCGVGRAIIYNLLAILEKGI